MVAVAIFHSALGVRRGELQAADLLESRGHPVQVADLYNGRTFDDYEEALEHIHEIGLPALMRVALDACAEMPVDFVTLGFSVGARIAQLVTAERSAMGAVMVSGARDPAELAITWPDGVPAQIHTTAEDPWLDHEAIGACVAAIRAAGATIEHFKYPGNGHLFADPSKSDEYQREETELMWSRVLDFVDSRRR